MDLHDDMDLGMGAQVVQAQVGARGALHVVSFFGPVDDG